MTDPQEDIPQPPEYDGPDWDEDDVPVAQCAPRTPEAILAMEAQDSFHVIPEGPGNASA